MPWMLKTWTSNIVMILILAYSRTGEIKIKFKKVPSLILKPVPKTSEGMFVFGHYSNQP